MARSLPYEKFRLHLEAEIRAYWQACVSLEYSSRFCNGRSPADRKKRVTQFPGDERSPFSFVDLSTDQLIANQTDVITRLRENAIVSFVTAFETYATDLLTRLIFLDPGRLSNSSIQISAFEAISFHGSIEEFKERTSRHVALRYTRNNSPKDLLQKCSNVLSYGIPSKVEPLIEEWINWTLVRNAVVHNSRSATQDLSEAYAMRFPNEGEPLSITDKEMSRVHVLALKILRPIDKYACDTAIKNHDALLLARELFVRLGLDSASGLAMAVNSTLGTRVSRGDIEMTLAQQRRHEPPIVGFHFPEVIIRHANSKYCN